MKSLFALILTLSLGLLAPATFADTNMCGGETQLMEPKGYQQLTVSSVALALTLPAGPVRKAVIIAETLPVRYRDDGTNPTASIGMLIFASATVNPTFTVCGAAIGAFRVIRATGADAVISISYYG